LLLTGCVIFGLLWVMLESGRRQDEREVNREYEEELAQLHADARRQLDAWKRNLAGKQADARRQHDQNTEQWLALVCASQEGAQRQQKEWDTKMAAKKAEALATYQLELACWKKAVAV